MPLALLWGALEADAGRALIESLSRFQAQDEAGGLGRQLAMMDNGCAHRGTSWRC